MIAVVTTMGRRLQSAPTPTIIVIFKGGQQ